MTTSEQGATARTIDAEARSHSAFGLRAWSIFRPLARVWRFARRRPWSAAAVGVSLVVAAAVAGWAYTRHQWRAAREALADDRPRDARRLLALPLTVWRWDPDVHVLA